MHNRFPVGRVAVSEWEVRLASTQALADPPIIVLWARPPNGESELAIFGEDAQPWDIENPSEGIYLGRVPITDHGAWILKWFAFDELGNPLDASPPVLIETDDQHFATGLPPLA